MQEADKIWFNGELVDWHDAKVHVLSHGLHYGTSVFEGIRAYDTEIGTAVFRLEDHLARMEASAGIYYINRLLRRGPETTGPGGEDGSSRRPMSFAEDAGREAIQAGE